MSSAATLPGDALPEPATAPQPLSLAEVLRVPVMRRLWYAQIVSNLGDFLALFAIISTITFNLGAAPAQVIGLQIAYLLPLAVLSMLAGVFADRWPLKTTLVASDLARAGLCLLLPFSHSVWHFYVILAAISVLSSFFGPAQGIAVRLAVPVHGLRSANTLMQQVVFGMRVVGPAAAALMVAKLGPNACYWTDAASFLASATLIGSLTLRRPEAAAAAEPQPGGGLRSVLPDMRVGVSFIFGHRGLLFAIAAFAAAMFVVGCFGPLIAVYVRDSLHARTQTFGYAQALIGVGMLLGAQIINSRARHVANTTLVTAGMATMAGSLCVLTLVAHIWSTFAANLLLGAAVALIVVPATTMMQAETPAHLMGRVGSTLMSIVFTAQILGLVLSGGLAAALGVRRVFAVCAALLAVLVVVGRLLGRLVRAEPTDAVQA